MPHLAVIKTLNCHFFEWSLARLFLNATRVQNVTKKKKKNGNKDI